jgi:hypothetical protein
MLTAIVLANLNENHRVERRGPEAVARTLAFLVSAAVQGVVADAVLVGEDSAAMRYIADYAGCTLACGSGFAEGLDNGLACARREHVFLLKTGYGADPALIEEVRDFLEYGRGGQDACGVVREAPGSVFTRLVPRASPVAGLVAARDKCRALRVRNLDDLARRLRPAVALKNSARRLL